MAYFKATSAATSAPATSPASAPATTLEVNFSTPGSTESTESTESKNFWRIHEDPNFSLFGTEI